MNVRLWTKRECELNATKTLSAAILGWLWRGTVIFSLPFRLPLDPSVVTYLLGQATDNSLWCRYNLQGLQRCLGASHGRKISLSLCFISPHIDVFGSTQVLSRDHNVATATLLGSLVLTRQTGTRVECFDWTVASATECRLLRKWHYGVCLAKGVTKPVGFVVAVWICWPADRWSTFPVCSCITIQACRAHTA